MNMVFFVLPRRRYLPGNETQRTQVVKGGTFEAISKQIAVFVCVFQNVVVTMKQYNNIVVTEQHNQYHTSASIQLLYCIVLYGIVSQSATY